MKFKHKVWNHKRKVGIGFRGYGPKNLEKKVPRIIFLV